MISKWKRSGRIKTLLAVLWFLFTFSLVSWWWIFALKQSPPSTKRMFAWEGALLLAAVFVGGSALVFLIYRDQKRHERLKLFFSTFSHDIKTSITRLRLQSEVLAENLREHPDPLNSQNTVLKRLLDDVTRLDLQLENALLLANLSDVPLYIEKLKLSKMIEKLGLEFMDLKIESNTDAEVYADQRLLLSVFRNLLQNSILHGQADRMTVNVTSDGAGGIFLDWQDNGTGFIGGCGEWKKLGEEVLTTDHTSGNGIGLFLSKHSIQKMKGKLSFSHQPNSGFNARLFMSGKIL